MSDDASTEHWEFYLTQVNSKPASISVDLALMANAPDPAKPSLLSIWLHLKHPHPEHDMSTNEEFDDLVKAEDSLVPALRDAFATRFAGRITGDGRREFYFYAGRNGDPKPAVTQALASAGLSGYSVDAWMQADPEWKQYRELLYPGPGMLRWIGDRRVVDSLAQNGDRPEVPRPIEHYAYFDGSAVREAFLQAAIALGFTLVRRIEPTAEHPRPGVIVAKTQPADLDTVHASTSALEKAATALGGEYDGWETVAVRDEDDAPKKKRKWQFWKK